MYAILVRFTVETLGRKVLLLRGAGTRMASYFYAMFRILRLKSVLGVTVSSDEVKKLSLTKRTQACIKDIKNEKFFRACYAVAKVTYPALKLLRCCDKASPVMGVLYHLSLRTTAALEHQAETLNEPHLFALGADGDVQQEVDEVFGPDMQVYNETVDSIEEARERGGDSDGSVVLNSQMSLHARFVWEWNKRKVKIEHEYAKAGFALSVSPDVWAHASQPGMLGPDVREALETVVRRLHKYPNPNNKTHDMDEDAIVDRFWSEFSDFRARRGVFESPQRWCSADALAGKSHLWHEKYSLHWTTVLGFVGCRVTSKVAGIGACERSWGDVKVIKSGKRSALSGESTEKRSIIYTTARVEEARLKRTAEEEGRVEAIPFEDQDLEFDEELSKAGVEVRDLKRPPRKRIVKAWLTEEERGWAKTRDTLNEVKLLSKIGGLNFYDIDKDPPVFYTVHPENMQWIPRTGYCAIGVKPTDKPEDEGEPFALDVVCELIAQCDEQPAGVEIVKPPAD